MSFYEAKEFFETALQHTDARNSPANWNMLNGLIKLSSSLQRLDSSVDSLQRDVKTIDNVVDRIERSTR